MTRLPTDQRAETALVVRHRYYHAAECVACRWQGPHHDHWQKSRAFDDAWDHNVKAHKADHDD